jgi:hypothetical protein
LSVDPGNAGARPDEPQTWNAFAYVHNNPLAFIDPSGTMDFASNCSGGDTDCARQEGAGLRDAAQAATVGGTARAATVGVRSEQVRDSYNAEVKPLDEADTTGRTNAKARARAQTPPEVRAVIESQQPGLGPKPGSGGTANSTSDVANRTAKKLGRAGRRVAGVGLVLVAVDVVTAENKTRAIVSNAGATVGGIAGGAGGATLGALTGPAAPVLAPAGGIAGSIGGGEAGARAAEALFDFFSPPPVVPVPTPGN